MNELIYFGRRRQARRRAGLPNRLGYTAISYYKPKEGRPSGRPLTIA